MAWWQVDLGSEQEITSVVVWNLTGELKLIQRLSNYRITILDGAGGIVASQEFHTTSGYTEESELWELSQPVVGKVVRVDKLGFGRDNNRMLALAEVEVFGAPSTLEVSSNTDYFPYKFEDSGEKAITAIDSNGGTTALHVNVMNTEISESKKIDLLHNIRAVRSYSSRVLDSELFVDGGQHIGVTENESENELEVSYNYLPTERWEKAIVWRLSENGPIVGSNSVNVIGFSDAAQNDAIDSFNSSNYPGFREVTTPIVITDIPEGGNAVVRIYRGGVTFLDGTKTLVLTAEDLVNGIATLKFLFSEELEGSFCHYVTIYDREGTSLGSR